MFKQKKIVVLMGGPGAEREVSIASGKAVLKALQDLGCQAEGLEVTDFTVEQLPEGTELVYNLIHGTFGEDGQLQALLDSHGIAYTGAGAESSRIAFDKNLAKEKFLAAGVPTPRSETIKLSPGLLPELTIKAPLVIKPPREGSSVGVQIVRDQAEVPGALLKAAEVYDEVLIENFIEGKELTVGIVNDQAMPIVHIAPKGGGSYDMANKYPWLSGAAGSDYYCPADLDEATTLAVQEAALAAHRSLSIEAYSRVDVLLDSENRPWVLEANTIPGMTATSLLPKSAAAGGIPFPALCQTIAEISLQLRS
ncbi:D-alanine--D-alanine ligase [Luteolibacter pohnpeiensis]|uniref:D-alanine--D-alanine ligase n=1 Tax=Luteolibacter pohnpeiensis TaxID=454153 RepID=A0A934S892_9BACT|nr:D-alanine--D-alanine ligase [Luteolibacter pohnpeiensis]MBK1883140.1 D-alanine--D-alanine ligase [Luteolibacter pohnpeiensis]